MTAIRYVPSVPPRGGERFDFLGAAVFLVGLLSFMLGLTFGQTRGFGHALPLGLLGLSALLLTLFVRIERVVEHPMLDLALFRSRLLSVNLFAGWASFAAIGGVFILLPFYLENVLGYSPMATGLLLASAPLALGVSAPFSGSVSDRVGPWPVILLGLVVLLCGYLLMMTLDTGTTAVGYLLTLVPVGLGMGIFQSPNNSAVMGEVPPHRLGVTSGLLTITRITGQLSGISVLGAVWAARVSAHAGTRGEPSAAPPAAQAAGLRETMIVSAALVGLSLALATRGWLGRREGPADRAAPR